MSISRIALIALVACCGVAALAQSDSPPTFSIRAGGGLFSDHRAKVFVGRGGFMGGVCYIPKWRSILAKPHFGEPSVDLDFLSAQAKGDKLTAASLMYAERVAFAHGVEMPVAGPYYGFGIGLVQVSTKIPGTFFQPPATKNHLTAGATFMLGTHFSTHLGLEASYRYVLKTFGFNASTVNLTLGYRF